MQISGRPGEKSVHSVQIPKENLVKHRLRGCRVRGQPVATKRSRVVRQGKPSTKAMTREPQASRIPRCRIPVLDVPLGTALVACFSRGEKIINLRNKYLLKE